MILKSSYEERTWTEVDYKEDYHNISLTPFLGYGLLNAAKCENCGKLSKMKAVTAVRRCYTRHYRNPARTAN